MGGTDDGAKAVTGRSAAQKPHPSAWAVGLFLLSSAFALIAMVLLFSTGWSPL
jgi:hypothetical protein